MMSENGYFKRKTFRGRGEICFNRENIGAVTFKWSLLTQNKKTRTSRAQNKLKMAQRVIYQKGRGISESLHKSDDFFFL